MPVHPALGRAEAGGLVATAATIATSSVASAVAILMAMPVVRCLRIAVISSPGERLVRNYPLNT